MTVYDKTDEFHWSADVSEWGRYDHGDVFVSLDPQKRLGEGTIVVGEYREDMQAGALVSRGLFWDKEQAEAYAEVLHDA